MGLSLSPQEPMKSGLWMWVKKISTPIYFSAPSDRAMPEFPPGAGKYVVPFSRELANPPTQEDNIVTATSHLQSELTFERQQKRIHE